jgi:hypothetical protein
MGTLAHDLAVSGVELRETHISWVFLGRDRVLKVKKPVDLGFLDFRTLAARRVACEAEVALNRRLAPDVYLGLVPVTRDASGRHALGGSGEPVDWAVEMRRLSDADACDARLRTGRLQRADLMRVAEHLARFHASARADAETAKFGSPAVIRRNAAENFEQTRESAPRYLDRLALAEIERWQLGFVDGHADLFERRAREGRVRDGHGDVRLEHVYLDAEGAIAIIDCIEFNERFRYADVCADLAFLAMDLASHRAPILAEHLCAAYARASDDWDLYALLDFYQGYRATVRAKVSAFLADEANAAPALRERAAREARRYFLLAQACEREPVSRPVLYAVGGVIASGKSTLADALSAATGAPVVDTDRARKHLAGVAPTTRLAEGLFTGAYAPETTDRVYTEVLRRANVVLGSGRPVVVDASFRSRALRARLSDLARARGVALRFVECCVPPAVARRRLDERTRGPSVSDGDLAAYEALARAWEPVTEFAPGEHAVLDATRPVAENLASVLDR